MKNGTDGDRIQDLDRQESLVDIGHKFQECINYYSSNVTIKNIGKTSMEKYIQCIVLNGKSRTCEWEWLAEENKFKIFVNQSNFFHTRLWEFKKFGVEVGDIFGVMRCNMKIQYLHGYVKFDLPFIINHPSKQLTQLLVSDEMKNEKIGIGLVLAASSLILLMVLAWTYRRRRIKRLTEKKKISR